MTPDCESPDFFIRRSEIHAPSIVHLIMVPHATLYPGLLFASDVWENSRRLKLLIGSHFWSHRCSLNYADTSILSQLNRRSLSTYGNGYDLLYCSARRLNTIARRRIRGNAMFSGSHSQAVQKIFRYGLRKIIESSARRLNSSSDVQQAPSIISS